MPQKTLIVLVGPTGVGKTETSLVLAETLHAPIINADSRQIYKGMGIGTAAPTPEEQARVEHHFVQFLNPGEYYSAAQFELDVMARLETLFQSHDYVLLSGGSMMYIDAVCKGIDDIPTVDAETRKMMLERYEAEGLERLCSELRVLDPEYYQVVDLKNPKRVIHALEICYMTGKTYTSFRTNTRKERPVPDCENRVEARAGDFVRPDKPESDADVGDGTGAGSLQPDALSQHQRTEYGGI